MKKLNINFIVNASVNQEITILNGMEPQEFFDNIESGDFLTSISSDDILSLPNLEKVGEITGRDTIDSDFSEFIIEEEE